MTLPPQIPKLQPVPPVTAKDRLRVHYAACELRLTGECAECMALINEANTERRAKR